MRRLRSALERSLRPSAEAERIAIDYPISAVTVDRLLRNGLTTEQARRALDSAVRGGVDLDRLVDLYPKPPLE